MKLTHNMLMDRLLTYINNNHKKNIICDFDKTLFKIILEWDKYFDEIRDKLITSDRYIFQLYEEEKISWSDMQNSYVLKYGEKVREIICLNNERSESILFKKAVANKSLLKVINLLDDCNIYIWSSNVKSLIIRILREYELESIFTKVISRNEVSLLKPYPEGFTILNNPSQPLNTYLFLGNSKADEEAAKKAGIDFWKVNYFQEGK